MAPFAHLHVHSCFSFHDGADTPAALVERAAALGCGALALTDTNGLYGAVPFCAACKSAGISPVLGAEIDNGAPAGPRAVVLARGTAGYPALCRLVTRRRLEWPEGGAQEGARRGPSSSADIDTGTDVGVARRGGLRDTTAGRSRGVPQRQDPGACTRDGSARGLRRSGAEGRPPGSDRREEPREGKGSRADIDTGTDAGVARRGGLRDPTGGRSRGVPQRQDPGAVHEAVTNLADLIAAEAGHVVVLAADPTLLRALAPHLPHGTLFGELVYAGDAHSAARCRETLAACRSLGVPPVATNAVRFASPEGFETHRLLRAIGENGTLWTTRPRAHPEHFLKGPAAMAALFAHLPEALENAARIAGECAAALGFAGWKFPAPVLPPGETPFSLLWQKSFEGLKERYRPLSRTAVERLRAELEVIEEKGFSPYFLVVDEIVGKARAWGLRTIGRGSAANSLVSYCLGFTHVDPLAHGLYFERFLNPERSSPPDIDLDFSWRDRDRLLAWVYERFGADRTAMISTHVTFGPRAAVREVGKAHGLPDDELTRLTRRIPHWGVGDLAALAAPGHAVPECRGLPADDETFRRILDLGGRIVGHPRHLSVHAGGIVIAPEPLTNLVPLERAAKGLVVTQYDMGPVEALGLVKIDLLAQRSLGVLQDAVAAVTAATGTAPPVDDRELVFADPATRALIREGRTMGCFYVESPAMRALLRKLRTETFEDLTAASSVIRPGVAESGMMQEYIRRHHIARHHVNSSLHEGRSGAEQCTTAGGVARRGGLRRRTEGSTTEVRSDRTPQATRTLPDETRGWYLDPRLEAVLGQTHGVMIYQEDVLRVAHTLAGMSLGQADTLRRSMSGKLRSPAAMAAVREGFLAGCRTGGVAAAAAEETWRQIESFAGYAFCKAHSASYALLSFQVAYLKAHHPAAFMAAVISNQGGFYGTPAYLAEARRMGLAILLPDVNRSGRDYTGRGRELRMGLMAFTGLPEEAVAGLLAARRDGGPFTNLTDLLARSGLGRAELELLVRGGACDGFELTRPELLWRLACRLGVGGQPPPEARDLFPGSGGLDHLVPRLPEYGVRERCRMEEEIFGFPVTRHPLELVAAGPSPGPFPAGGAREGAGSPGLPLVTAERMALFAGRRVRMRGLAISYKRIPVRKGRGWMKFLSLEDLTGTFEATLFPAVYARYAEATLGAGPYLLAGRVELDHGVPALTVEHLESLDPPGPAAAGPGNPCRQNRAGV